MKALRGTIEACPPGEPRPKNPRPNGCRPRNWLRPRPSPNRWPPTSSPDTAAEGIDVSGLTARMPESWKPWKNCLFKDDQERLKELRELVGYVAENRRAAKKTERRSNLKGRGGERGGSGDRNHRRSRDRKLIPIRSWDVFDPERRTAKPCSRPGATPKRASAINPRPTRPKRGKRWRLAFRERLDQFKEDLMEKRRGMGAILEFGQGDRPLRIETEAGRPLRRDDRIGRPSQRPRVARRGFSGTKKNWTK